MKSFFRRVWTAVCWKIACWLPRDIVYLAAIRLGANATTGKWSDQVVPELRFMEAVKRWGDPR